MRELLNKSDLVVINEVIGKGKSVLIKPTPGGIKILEQKESLIRKKASPEPETTKE